MLQVLLLLSRGSFISEVCIALISFLGYWHVLYTFPHQAKMGTLKSIYNSKVTSVPLYQTFVSPKSGLSQK